MINSLIHKTIKNEKTSRTAFWFMRQAGRYLPEYRDLRTTAGGFLNLCFNPDYAAEVTLQPIRRFNMDAAIIFSDILVIPHAMGVEVTFEKGEGPKLSPTRTVDAANKLHFNIKKLNPVFEALKKVRGELAEDKSLIGFCGAPWTVACYMVEGQGSRDYEYVREFAFRHEEIFSVIIDRIVESSAKYLSMQVNAGADIVQIFDSWAGVLSENEYKKWVIEPTKKLISFFKSMHPHIPVIGFPRGSGLKYQQFASELNVDVVGIDVQTPLEAAKEIIQKPLQGNLDPVLLTSDKHRAVAETKRILETMRGRPFIFNLGHGILQTTPIENVEAVCDAIFGRK